MIDVAQVPKWLILDAVGHVLASRTNWWNHALCGLSTPSGEVTQDKPPRICRACRTALTNPRRKRAKMAKHTPGPWTIEEYGDEDAPTLVIHRDSETRICFMATSGAHGDPAKIEADARLIAAAPDLLGACQMALGAFEKNHAIDWSILHQAILKATGSPTTAKGGGNEG